MLKVDEMMKMRNMEVVIEKKWMIVIEVSGVYVIVELAVDSVVSVVVELVVVELAVEIVVEPVCGIYVLYSSYVYFFYVEIFSLLFFHQ
jgi:hypothetical protein